MSGEDPVDVEKVGLARQAWFAGKSADALRLYREALGLVTEEYGRYAAHAAGEKGEVAAAVALEMGALLHQVGSAALRIPAATSDAAVEWLERALAVNRRRSFRIDFGSDREFEFNVIALVVDAASAYARRGSERMLTDGRSFLHTPESRSDFTRFFGYGVVAVGLAPGCKELVRTLSEWGMTAVLPFSEHRPKEIVAAYWPGTEKEISGFYGWEPMEMAPYLERMEHLVGSCCVEVKRRKAATRGNV